MITGGRKKLTADELTNIIYNTYLIKIVFALFFDGEIWTGGTVTYVLI